MSNIPVPMKITLYDPETNEVIKEHTRLFVPWKFFKRAITLAKKFDQEDFSIDQVDEDMADEMTALVVSVFGNAFTAEELETGATLDEMFTVIQNIIGNVSKIGGNPTKRAAKKN